MIILDDQREKSSGEQHRMKRAVTLNEYHHYLYFGCPRGNVLLQVSIHSNYKEVSR